MAANDKNRRITCDFDLVKNQPSILKHLPKFCQDAYNKNDDLVNEMIDESKLFQEFQEKLDKYEIEKSDDKPTNTIPSKQWEFRYNVYNETNLNECFSKTNQKDFLECLKFKRNEMIKKIV